MSDIDFTKKTYSDFLIKVSLNPSLCDKTFKDALRTPEKGHPETLLADVNAKSRKKREQVSNVFNGEENAKQPSHKPPVYVGSTLMFNDSYIEKHPKIDKGKFVRYEVEKKIKESSHLYSDDLYISPERQLALARKLKDNYGTNPIKILTPVQNNEMNESYRNKIIRRTETINDYMGSNKIKKTFKNLKFDALKQEKTPKITTENISVITANLKNRECKTDYKKRHFRVASANGVAFTYF